MKNDRLKTIKRTLMTGAIMASLVINFTGCAGAGQETKETKKAPAPASISQPSGNAGELVANRLIEIFQGAGIDVQNGAYEKKSVTVMVYMNGSDLETQGGSATADISEMLDSKAGENVNVVIQTMGTRQWQNNIISNNTAQTFVIKDGNLELVRDNLGKLDCTSKDTLSEFIGFCKSNYPADRNMLLLWDHGGGPVYGFGYDEWQNDEMASLSLSEMAKALEANKDVHFDLIGMDCCIMSSLETCYALAPYCMYTLLSEDFESGLGWSYKGWLDTLEENPGITTPILGKKIIDEIISSNDTSPEGSSSCISLINESTVENLFKAWKAYAYKNQETFFAKNYSRQHKSKGRGSNHGGGFSGSFSGGPGSGSFSGGPGSGSFSGGPGSGSFSGGPGGGGFSDYDMYNWGDDMSYVTLEDYYLTDMMAVVESVDSVSDEAKNLISALKAALTYNGHTRDKNELTGMAIALPYGDSTLYEHIKEVYKDTIDKDYIDWLSNFTIASDDHYDYGDFENSWYGWGDYEREYGYECTTGCFGSHAYDYSSGCFYGHEESALSENWIYDYEDDIWYMVEDGTVFLYDDNTNKMYFYDDEYELLYEYDDSTDSWILSDD
ncbi:MAG: hypothetical protein IK152_10130 [Lachnospiraceae bacterium]|nr:hypothetical protein [Lachnospiraceae bacterium]